MNAVIGASNLLLDTQLSAEQKQLLQTTLRSGESLLTIINDILDYSKVEAGEMRLEKTNFVLKEIIKDIRELFALELDRKDLKLFTKVDPKIPAHLCGDSGRIRQILLNLIGNAIKFTEEGSIKLSVELAEKNNESNELKLKFVIIDTGIGISKEAQMSLFKEFTQQDPSISRKFGGTGLGLAICKRIIELMGGTIKLESEELKGSKFTFEVIMWETSEEDMEQTFKDHAQPPIQNKYESDKPNIAYRRNGRILLVEDSPANQVIALAILRKAGFIVDAVANGKEAVEAVQELPYDVVLMDVAMPVMDGFEATKNIRALKNDKSKIPIIAMTANAVQGDRESCLNHKMDDYLTKPINRILLLEKLDSWMGKAYQQSNPNQYGNSEIEDELHIVNEAILQQLEEDTGFSNTADIIKIFLNETKQRLATLKQAAKMKNYPKIGQEIHTLKSTAGTYGVSMLQHKAEQMDLAYKANDYQKLDAEMSALIELGKQSLEELARYYQINDGLGEVSNG